MAQQPQHGHEPGTELQLASMPSARSTGGWRWNLTFAPRGQVARSLDVQARDLVLVLVGDQLVEPAGDGLGHRGAAGQRCASLARLHTGDRLDVAGGGALATPADEVGDADREQPPQLAVLGRDAIDQRRLRASGASVSRPCSSGVDRVRRRHAGAAPLERGEVGLDRDAVETERLVHRRERDRNRAPLPGGAEHDDVGRQMVGRTAPAAIACASRKTLSARARRAVDRRPRRGSVEVGPARDRSPSARSARRSSRRRRPSARAR